MCLRHRSCCYLAPHPWEEQGRWCPEMQMILNQHLCLFLFPELKLSFAAHCWHRRLNKKMVRNCALFITGMVLCVTKHRGRCVHPEVSVRLQCRVTMLDRHNWQLLTLRHSRGRIINCAMCGLQHSFALIYTDRNRKRNWNRPSQDLSLKM